MPTLKTLFTLGAAACFVCYLIWPKAPLIPVGGLCLCIANFVP